MLTTTFAIITFSVFNFKLLPIKQAIKLPIYIYGPIKFYWLCGKIELRSEKIFSGMIKLGRNNEFFNGTDKSSFILMEKNSKIIFEGPCAIGNNYKIRVTQNAELIFGAYTFLALLLNLFVLIKLKLEHTHDVLMKASLLIPISILY